MKPGRQAARGALQRLGYLLVEDPASPDYHLFAKPPSRPRSHHLHVCRAGSRHEARHLAVRDFLRANRDEAVAYEMLKRSLARHHREDRLSCIAGKANYVDGLEARAIRWAATRASPGWVQ